jgi:hypothetical protein
LSTQFPPSSGRDRREYAEAVAELRADSSKCRVYHKESGGWDDTTVGTLATKALASWGIDPEKQAK